MLTSLVYSYRGLNGQSYLAVVAKRTYSFRHAARAEVAIEQASIQRAPVLAPALDGAALRLVHDTDLTAGPKATTDVLLRGSACSLRGPTSSLSAGLRVGPTAKVVTVWGERRILLGKDRTITFSSPEPFTSMPLVWDRAYGGRDAHAESKEAGAPRPTGLGGSSIRDVDPALGMLSYPRNPFGRGFFIDVDRERVHDTLAPNLEDQGDPVHPDRLLVEDYLAWIDCPVAACFEPIDLFTFPRALFFMPADHDEPSRPIHELVSGFLSAADLARAREFHGSPHPRSLNCAPAGLATHRLYGAERVQLWNLHPRHELLEFDLPGERPRLLVEPQGVRAREMDPLLQTILIEPEVERVTLTWMGVMEVASPYPQQMTEQMRHAVIWNR